MSEFLSDTLAYAGRLLDSEELGKSSSGGAFTALSNWAFSNDYIVVCSSYDYDQHAQVFKFVDNIEKRNDARGSKYVQAIPNIPYHEMEQWILDNTEKKILFVGMGCQVAAVAKYAEIKGIRKHFLLVDIICHGVASPRIWKEYIQNIETNNGKICYINFKDKRFGWDSPVAVASTKQKEIDLTPYVNLFYSGDILRPSCSQCPYATTERVSDITIGDFWGIREHVPDFYDNRGTSLFLIHTEDGEKVFGEIKNQLNWRKSNIQDSLQPNLCQPTKVNPDRNSFWKDYFKYGIGYVTKKYGQPKLTQKIVRKVKKMLKSIRV